MVDSVRMAEGDCTCRIQDPAGGTIQAQVAEISITGALLTGVEAVKHPLAPNTYVDCKLEVKGHQPRQLFAHVVSQDEQGLRLRWMHFDPVDELKLRKLVETYKPGAAHATRRVIKPSSTSLPSESDKTVPGPAAPAGPAGVSAAEQGSVKASVAGPAAAGTAAQSARVGTRRVLKPSSAPKPANQLQFDDDSRANPVVIASTERFEKLAEAPITAEVQPFSTGRDPAHRPPAPSKEKETAGAPLEPLGAAAAAGKAPAEAESAAAPAASAPAKEASAGYPIQPVLHADESREGLTKEANVEPQAKTVTVSKDGRMDIGASIRSRAKTVMASELAARHEKVRVLNMGTIKTLIQEAVSEAAGHLTRALGEAERKRLLEEAEEGFKERLKAFQLEKAGAEEKLKALNDQLKAAQSLLEQERKRTIAADQFTVSEKGLEEIDGKMSKLLQRALSSGSVGPDVELKLRELVSHVLDSEREKIRAKELEAQNSKIELLEKKVKRLAGSLEEVERQRNEFQELAAALEKSGGGGGGLRNVLKAGMKGDDPDKTRKLELMKTILEENRALREKLGISLNQVTAEVAKAAEDAGVMSAQDATAAMTHEAAPGPEPTPAVGEAAIPEADAAGSSDPVDPDAPLVNPDDEAWSPEVDPDDQPWEAKPITFEGGETEAGVKKMRIANPLAFTPPPLERK